MLFCDEFSMICWSSSVHTELPPNKHEPSCSHTIRFLLSLCFESWQLRKWRLFSIITSSALPSSQQKFTFYFLLCTIRCSRLFIETLNSLKMVSSFIVLFCVLQIIRTVLMSLFFVVLKRTIISQRIKKKFPTYSYNMFDGVVDVVCGNWQYRIAFDIEAIDIKSTYFIICWSVRCFQLVFAKNTNLIVLLKIFHLMSSHRYNERWLSSKYRN